jgi:hypothetical protein
MSTDCTTLIETRALVSFTRFYKISFNPARKTYKNNSFIPY